MRYPTTPPTIRITLIAATLILLLIPNPTRAQCDAESDIIITANVDNPTPYVGEQIIYTMRIENNTTQLAPVPRFPTFEGFWSGGTISRETETICGGTVGVTTHRKALFPLQPGPQTITPGSVDFSSNPVYEAASVISSQELTINAQPLPPSAPASFSGAVGIFPLITATITDPRLNAGDPLTLRLTLQDGIGNIDQLDPPPLPLPDDWRIYPQPAQADFAVNPLSGRIGGTKTFEWSIIPTQTGAIQFPPIPFTYFDPARATYQTVTTTPIDITITPNNRPQPTTDPIQPDDLTTAPARTTWSLKPIATTANPRPLAYRPAAWLLPPLILIGAFGIRWYHTHHQHTRRRHRQTQAFKATRSRLAKVTKMRGDAAYQAFVHAVFMYFGDKWQTEPLALNSTTIADHLLDHNIPPDLINTLHECITTAYEQRYAPTESAPLGPLVRQTLTVLAHIDRILEANTSS